MNLANKKYNEARKVRFENVTKKLYAGIPSRGSRTIKKHGNKRSGKAIKNAGGHAVHMDKPSKARRFTFITSPPKSKGIVKFSRASKRA